MSGVPKVQSLSSLVFPENKSLISCLQEGNHMTTWDRKALWGLPTASMDLQLVLIFSSHFTPIDVTQHLGLWVGAFLALRGKLLPAQIIFILQASHCHLPSLNCHSFSYFPSFKHSLNFLGLLLSPLQFSQPPFGFFIFQIFFSFNWRGLSLYGWI